MKDSLRAALLWHNFRVPREIKIEFKNDPRERRRFKRSSHYELWELGRKKKKRIRTHDYAIR